MSEQDTKQDSGPTCDICKQHGVEPPKPATYDAPIGGVGGPWAFVCEDHENLAAIRYGTSLAKPEADDPDATPTDDIKRVSVPLTLDSVVEVKCPTCGLPRRVEPDANYVVTCDECGQEYQLHSML